MQKCPKTVGLVHNATLDTCIVIDIKDILEKLDCSNEHTTGIRLLDECVKRRALEQAGRSTKGERMRYEDIATLYWLIEHNHSQWDISFYPNPILNFELTKNNSRQAFEEFMKYEGWETHEYTMPLDQTRLLDFKNQLKKICGTNPLPSSKRYDLLLLHWFELSQCDVLLSTDYTHFIQNQRFDPYRKHLEEMGKCIQRPFDLHPKLLGYIGRGM